MKFSYRGKVSKLLLLSMCAALLFSLTGCWDRKELNDEALILGSAIDKKENGTIELSVQVFVPKTAGGGQPGGMTGGGEGGTAEQTFVRSATGLTVAEALSKLRERFPRETFWGHDKILVIGEKMAKEGVSDLVDFLMRFPEARVRLKVYISHGSARHILELIPPLERTSVMVLRKMSEEHSVMDVTIKTFSQMLAGNAGASAVPLIVILPPEPGKNKNKTTPYINGTAVLKKDKMVGRIDEKVSKGVLWLRNEIKTAVVTVASKESKGFVTVNVIRSKTELVPDIKENQWSMTVKIKPEARVIENTTNLSFKNPKFSKGLEKELNETIENRVKAALVKVQEGMHADIFDFAEAFYRKYPIKWEQAKDKWDEQFPKVKVNIQVATKILSPGISDTGISRPEKEVKKK